MDYLYAFTMYVCVFIVVVVLFYIYDKVDGVIHPPKVVDKAKIEKDIDIYTDNLRSLDTDAYKNRFNVEVPEDILNFFYTAPLRDYYYGFWVSPNAEDKYEGWFVSDIYALNAEAIERTHWPETVNYYRLAGTGLGDEYLIDPKNRNAEVILFDHETRDKIGTGMTLAQFLSPKNIYLDVDKIESDEPYEESWLEENATVIKVFGVIFVVIPMVAYTIRSLF